MDREVIIDLIQQHGKAVYNFCLYLTGNRADADDLYQETFLKAVELCHKIDPNHHPKGFLLSIAIRLHRNQRRKLAWRRRIVPLVHWQGELDEMRMSKTESSPEETVIFNENQRMIQVAIEQLHDKFKVPLYLYYTADLSIDEIAQVLNIPSGTVKSRLYHARKRLKYQLEVEFR